jgi:hypothetical protein
MASGDFSAWGLPIYNIDPRPMPDSIDLCSKPAFPPRLSQLPMQAHHQQPLQQGDLVGLVSYMESTKYGTLGM